MCNTHLGLAGVRLRSDVCCGMGSPGAPREVVGTQGCHAMSAQGMCCRVLAVCLVWVGADGGLAGNFGRWHGLGKQEVQAPVTWDGFEGHVWSNNNMYCRVTKMLCFILNKRMTCF